MSVFVFGVVLLAALLHAVWNALVKGGADKTGAMGAVVLGQGAAGAALLPFATLPAAEGLPYLALGVGLHLGYQLFLILSYRLGDLTQVYPIARGVAPLLVALRETSIVFALLIGVFLLGERLNLAKVAATMMTLSGVILLRLNRS